MKKNGSHRTTRGSKTVLPNQLSVFLHLPLRRQIRRHASLYLTTLLLGSAAATDIKAAAADVTDAAEFSDHPDLQTPQIAGALHYLAIGTAKTAVALWIHGTPGGWADIRGLLLDTAFTAEVRLVAVDRPGWGLSTPPAANSSSAPRWGNFNDHSVAFTPLLKQLRAAHPDVPLIVAGHSWGGSFAPTLAADHPDLVDGLLLLASSLEPALGQPRWYNRVANTWLMQKLLPESLLNANREIYALHEQLSLQRPRLSQLKMPVLFVQGLDDKLVSTDNADFAARAFDPATTGVVQLPDQGHLLQFERPPLIGRCIIALAKNQLALCRE